MEQEIKINLKEETCDIEIHGLNLRHINNLTVMREAVADNLKHALIASGMPPARAAEGISLLLQGNLSVGCILKEVLRAGQNRCN